MPHYTYKFMDPESLSKRTARMQAGYDRLVAEGRRLDTPEIERLKRDLDDCYALLRSKDIILRPSVEEASPNQDNG